MKIEDIFQILSYVWVLTHYLPGWGDTQPPPQVLLMAFRDMIFVKPRLKPETSLGWSLFWIWAPSRAQAPAPAQAQAQKVSNWFYTDCIWAFTNLNVIKTSGMIPARLKTISKSRSRCPTPDRNLQDPPQPQIRNQKTRVFFAPQNQDGEPKFG